MGSLSQNHGAYTVIVAFSIELFNSPDGPAFSAWKNGYAIEMTFDNEWPFKFVSLVPPSVFKAFAQNDLNEFDIELGLSHLTVRNDMEELISLGARWASVFPNEEWTAIQKTGIGLIFHISEEREFDSWDLSTVVESDTIVLAVQGDASMDQTATIERINSIRSAWRKLVPQVEPQVFVSTGIVLDREQDFSPLINFVSGLPEIDGLFFANAYPGFIADVCSKLHEAGIE